MAALGSSGGISPTYAIPIWQQGINMTTNHGSTTMRNVPDVALTADNIFIIADTNQQEIVGGTSCAAPLWAGFTALGEPAGGRRRQTDASVSSIRPFTRSAKARITPPISTTSSPATIFGSGSPTNFPAVPGYDLCTGWGTPPGQI